MKTCNKCVTEKPLERFSKDKHKKDGLCTVCKECKSEYRSAYHVKHKEALCERSRKWYQENREQGVASRKSYRLKNIERSRELRKQQYWRNPAAAKASVKEYNRERARVDPVFRMAQRCKKRIWAALNEGGYTKKSRSFEIIGCTPQELANHLASQFVDGMTFDNYGAWHIDHIVPLASAKTEKDVISLCHYSNLQPLWAQDNLRKSARLDYRKDKASA